MTVLDISPVEKLLVSPKRLPILIRKRFLSWVEFVELHGIEMAQETIRFRDHPLKGPRSGQRSIYLDKQWRAIYKVTRRQITLVTVEEITPHDYRIK